MPIYTITSLQDKAVIRRFLQADSAYAAYALGDLEPPLEQHAAWFGAHGDDELAGLALIFSGLEPPNLFLMGSDPAINALLMQGVGPDEVWFNARPEHRPLLETWYTLVETTSLFRMQVTPDRFKPALEARFPLQKLDASKTDEINTFFALTEEKNETIVAFVADQIKEGFFHGIYLEERLIAAAGTHFVANEAKLAALGNVMTHPGYRGKGLGKATSNAVVAALFEAGIETVVLNVAQDNEPALAIYESLGFERAGELIEGQARRA